MTTATPARSVSTTRRKTLHELRTLIKQKDRSELAFKCITSGAKFHDHVIQRLENPYYVRQGNTPLCGPAAFMFCVAKHFPDHYERYALELALYGKSRIGDLIVEPSESCLNARDGLEMERKNDFSSADWVTLASLRDSANILSRMSGPASNIAGMTFPGEIQGWFEKTGLFTQIEDHTSTVITSSYDNLLRANEKVKAGHCVCFLIQASILAPHLPGTLPAVEFGVDKVQKDIPKVAAPFPNHWVVQTSNMLIDQKPAPQPNTPLVDKSYNSRLYFEVHSWGMHGRPYKVNNRVDEMTPEKFTKYYHGFVCAEPKLN